MFGGFGRIKKRSRVLESTRSLIAINLIMFNRPKLTKSKTQFCSKIQFCHLLMNSDFLFAKKRTKIQKFHFFLKFWMFERAPSDVIGRDAKFSRLTSTTKLSGTIGFITLYNIIYDVTSSS